VRGVESLLLRQQIGRSIAMTRRWLVIIALTSAAPVLAGEPGFAEAVSLLQQGRTTQAYHDLQLLAEAGDTRAQYFLGVALIEGKVVTRDLVHGYAWLQIAAECGIACDNLSAVDRAADARHSLGNLLDGRQLIEAERVADAYLAPRRKTYEEAHERVTKVLMGEMTAADVTVYYGCAARPQTGKCRGKPPADPARPSCAGIEPKPDKEPSVIGPLARILYPWYPASAQGLHDEGRPVIEMHVDHTGYVCRLAIVRGSGNKSLDAAAVEAAVLWRLQPATLGSATVEALHTLKVSFANPDLQLDE